MRWKGNVLKCLIIQFKQSLQVSLRFASMYPCGYRFDFSSFKVLSFNLSLSNCISSVIPEASKITFLYYHAAYYKTVHVIFHHWLPCEQSASSFLDMLGRGRRLCRPPRQFILSMLQSCSKSNATKPLSLAFKLMTMRVIIPKKCK